MQYKNVRLIIILAVNAFILMTLLLSFPITFKVLFYFLGYVCVCDYSFPQRTIVSVGTPDLELQAVVSLTNVLGMNLGTSVKPVTHS